MGQSLIKTNADGSSTSIPMHLDNVDYQEYLVWIAAGNTPTE